jgi:hypothetical protein
MPNRYSQFKKLEVKEYLPRLGDLVANEHAGQVWIGLVVGECSALLPSRDPSTGQLYNLFTVFVLRNDDFPNQEGHVTPWSTVGGWSVISEAEVGL